VVLPSIRVPGVQVTIDDRPVSEVLWYVGAPVDIGTHAVVATAPGKAPFRTTVRIDDEGQYVWAQVLGFQDAPPQSEIVTAAPTERPLDVLARAEGVAERKTLRTVGVVTLTTGSVIAAAGLVFGGIALGNVGQANECTQAAPCQLRTISAFGVMPPVFAPDDVQRLENSLAARERTKTFGTLSTVAVPIGIVTMAIGIYLVVRSRDQANDAGALQSRTRAAHNAIRITPFGVEF
jgi:hypothetical protein